MFRREIASCSYGQKLGQIIPREQLFCGASFQLANHRWRQVGNLPHFHLVLHMNSVWDFANPQLRDLAVYEPGKPIEETARELGVEPSTIIKLASNENPLGPSPRAI